MSNFEGCYYNIYFEDDGYCTMYEVQDSNYWTYEEAMRIVRMENAKLIEEEVDNGE